jgi:hypothetical protein
MLDVETFVVCDEITAAGTFDRLWRCPDGKVRVGDLKSGKSEADYPLATTMQLAIYAHGCATTPRPASARRSTRPRPERGAADPHAPTGGCRVIPLDLEKGWQAARLAAEVHHDVRKWKAADLIRRGRPAGAA